MPYAIEIKPTSSPFLPMEPLMMEARKMLADPLSKLWSEKTSRFCHFPVQPQYSAWKITWISSFIRQSSFATIISSSVTMLMRTKVQVLYSLNDFFFFFFLVLKETLLFHCMNWLWYRFSHFSSFYRTIAYVLETYSPPLEVGREPVNYNHLHPETWHIPWGKSSSIQPVAGQRHSPGI